jgi:hypothetical protein
MPVAGMRMIRQTIMVRRARVFADSWVMACFLRKTLGCSGCTKTAVT